MPPWLAEVLQALSEAPGVSTLRQSSTAYLLVNAAHILGLGALVGSIATLDLRILGLFRAAPLPALARPLSAMAASGLALAILTGFALFSIRPLAYAENPAFLAKLVLVALGILNALALRANWRWRVALQGGPLPPAARISAALSLLIWAGAVLAGRWIGFLQ